jgi:predicted nucleotide-binding protein
VTGQRPFDTTLIPLRKEGQRVPTNLELLQGLRDGFENMAYRDKEKLSELSNRGRMLIRRAFGEDSYHYHSFVQLNYYPMVYPASPDYEQSSWEGGQRSAVHLLDSMIEELELDAEEHAPIQQVPTGPRSNRVFVVHGHDNEMKQAVARTVERLGLEAVILHERPNRGQTLIEKIERYSEVDFAVVLLSPDDTGYANADGPDTAKPRARQNVILELGYFAGKLGRGSVVALHRGGIEFPSDYDGVLYTPYDGDSGAWRSELVAELRESGYAVSADNL